MQSSKYNLAASFCGRLALSLLGLAPLSALAAPKPAAVETVQLSIGGGSIDSAAFRWSSALAQILSRPPGLPDCDPSAPCGVPGVVAGAQTYDDSQAALAALLDGRVATAIIPANLVYRARCALAEPELSPIAVLKTLYRQPVEILARADMAAAGPKGLIGKTIAVGLQGSDSDSVAMAMFDAYGLPRAKVKLLRLSPSLAAEALKNGSAVAAIFLGHAYDMPIADLIGNGFTLMSLPDTPERKQMLEALPAFEASAIPPGSYPGVSAVSTLAQPVVWVAGSGFAAHLSERLITTISEPHNLARLSDLVAPLQAIAEGVAYMHLPAPLTEASIAYAKAAKIPIEILECAPHQNTSPLPPKDKRKPKH